MFSSLFSTWQSSTTCFLTSLTLAALVLPAEAAQLIRWKLGTQQRPLEFVTDVPVKPRAQFLLDPPRIVVDLPGVVLERPTLRQAGQGVVQQFRLGQLDARTARLVIELDPTQDIDPTQVQIRGITETQWIVEISPTASPNLAQQTTVSPDRADEPQALPDLQEDLETPQERLPLGEDSELAESITVTLPPSPLPLDSMSPTALAERRPLVIIDAGHGGPDPGAVGRDNLRETDITLDVAQQVAQQLENMGIATRMTRTGEYDLDLAPRVNMAEQLNATLFVSIHANSISLERPDVSGLETYYYDSGLNLAKDIHQTILDATGMKDRGVRKARFYVLTRTSMPAVLVETGFVTGMEDANNFRNPRFRSQMAEAIARGVSQYLNVMP